MKKKKILVIVLTFFVLLTSGCTKYLTDDDNKKVTNETTGSALTSNILCKPTKKELVSLYEEHKENLEVDYDKLNICKDFSPSDIKYNSLSETLFVKPLAWIIIKIGNLFSNYGIAVMLVGLLIRVVLMPFTKKTALQSQNMKKAQPELSRIENKYKDKTDNDALMQKSQETMAVYKKYNINPIGGCLIAFIQLPLFFAFLEAINRVPAIFEGKLLTLQLGTTPLVGMTKGLNKASFIDILGTFNYQYLILVALIIVTTYFSFKLTMNTTGNPSDPNQKQMQFMSKIMIIFIAFASFSLPAAIGLYWIVTNAFAVVQNMIIKRKM